MDELMTADTQPEVSTEAAEDTPSGTLEVKFNKQTHILSPDEAVRYAQLGMKYDSVAPLLDSLKEHAAREGKTLKDWVGALSACPPPDPAADVVERLAAEYTALREEVPTVGEFDTLPPEVVRQATEEGIPLLDAYLRYEYRQRRRAEDERRMAAAAAAAATGSLASGATADVSPTESAMLRGIWGR